MSDREEQRRLPDRRRQPRGGRRPHDVPGYTPLVYVIDPRPSGRATCEAILAKLRFAVAPFDSVEQATRVLNALRPDIVLVVSEHVDTMREAVAVDRDRRPVPVVAIPDENVEPTALVEAVRLALRVTPFKTAGV